MWYAIQVIGGQESIVKGWIEKTQLAGECFIPLRERSRKYRGAWRLTTEKLIPGYLFVVTDTPEQLLEKLRNIPRFTKLLGVSDDGFIPLTRQETDFLSKIGGEQHISRLSQVEIDEGSRVRIVAGNLKHFEGDVVKIDFHRRTAVIRIPFMGRTVDFHMGIEIIEKAEQEKDAANEKIQTNII